MLAVLCWAFEVILATSGAAAGIEDNTRMYQNITRPQIISASLDEPVERRRAKNVKRVKLQRTYGAWASLSR